MIKTILSKEQVLELVSQNRYKVDPKTKFLSRCIDGRYPTSLKFRGVSQNLPALAFPGADAGELALIFATANSYGFEVDKEKVFNSLVEVIGGVEKLQFHTDSHAKKNQVLAGCGHIKQISLKPQAYNLQAEQVDFIKEKIARAKDKGATEIILEDDHLEGAVVIVKGNQGLFPRFDLETDGGNAVVQIFIYHQSIVDERHRRLAKKLIANQAVKLSSGCGEDYLYQALSEMAENHLMETTSRLAKGLPIFEINFDNNGGLEIKERGKV